MKAVYDKIDELNESKRINVNVSKELYSGEISSSAGNKVQSSSVSLPSSGNIDIKGQNYTLSDYSASGSNSFNPTFDDSFEYCYNHLIDDAIFGIAFEMHRASKTGTFFIEDVPAETQEKYRILRKPNADIFGQPLGFAGGGGAYNRQWECQCPECNRTIAACRLAPHLEKCMGMGRSSSRLASRRIAAASSGLSSSRAASCHIQHPTTSSSSVASSSGVGGRRSRSSTPNGNMPSDDDNNNDDDDDDWFLSSMAAKKRSASAKNSNKRGGGVNSNNSKTSRKASANARSKTTAGVISINERKRSLPVVVANASAANVISVKSVINNTAMVTSNVNILDKNCVTSTKIICVNRAVAPIPSTNLVLNDSSTLAMATTSSFIDANGTIVVGNLLRDVVMTPPSSSTTPKHLFQTPPPTTYGLPSSRKNSDGRFELDNDLIVID